MRHETVPQPITKAGSVNHALQKCTGRLVLTPQLGQIDGGGWTGADGTALRFAAGAGLGLGFRG